MQEVDSKTHIKISKEDLIAAAGKGSLRSEQVDPLWQNLLSSSSMAQSNRMLRYVYYLGALVTIVAMAWFMASARSWVGWGGISLIALAYGIAFFFSGFWLWKKEGLRIPGGLLATAAVCMAPLAIFGFEHFIGIWPSNVSSDYFVSLKGCWFFMEIGTIAVGLAALKFIPFPFLTAPIAASLWLLSIDLILLFTGTPHIMISQTSWISVVFGLAMLFCSYLIDKKTKEDFAFWGYLFGTFSFWGGLSVLTFSSEFSWFFYLCINIAMMVVAVLLLRNVLMVFGAIGVFSYLCYLAYIVFGQSVLFPFVLGFIGIAMIALAICYQKKRWPPFFHHK